MKKKIYKFDIVIQLYSKLCTPKKHNGMFEEMVLKQASFMNKKIQNLAFIDIHQNYSREQLWTTFSVPK